MARSSYIYLVYGSSFVVGAFTVKYEMERWLKTYDGPVTFIERHRDGQPGKMTLISRK